MKRKISAPGFIQNQSGMTLISVAFFIVVLGFFLVAGILFYDLWKKNKAAVTTAQKLEYAQEALHAYRMQNGRYPCPAPLNADIDTTGFGTEVTNDCLVGNQAGTFRAGGEDGRPVRTGALPVRTLNIPDEYTYDGYGHRLVYAVTEWYATDSDRPPNDSHGDISIVDRQGNNATAREGNIVQIVYSMGWDDNGAYSINGQLIEPCNSDEISGENCNFDVDATFLNSVNKSEAQDNVFVQTITYPPSDSREPCDVGNSPKDVIFLLDSSNSMRGNGFCPMGGPCWRIHDAQWAMRRILLSRLHTNQYESDPGVTSFTNFLANDAPPSPEDPDGMTYPNDIDGLRDILDNTNIVFNDPSVNTYPTETEALASLESQLQNMCPIGQTPLGDHLRVLADYVGDGEPDRPNKIVVLSDGTNTLGMDPIVAANEIHTLYPNLQIDIIDVAGNPSLEDITTITGGTYYSTDNPDDLIQALNQATGVCGNYSPPIPNDPKHCN